MIIALFPNETKQHSLELAEKVSHFFQEKGVCVAAEDSKASEVHAIPLSQVDHRDISFLISMGGDGTLLRAAHHFGELCIPILGINLGSLGFIADVPLKELFESLQDLLDGKYMLENRLILQGTLLGKNPLYAMNDFVIHRASYHSLIKLAIQVDHSYVDTFVADGIIIATPTGSTAYSLACGGPILSPTLPAFVLTPICPHTISNRPIVLTQEHVVTITYLSDHPVIETRADGLFAHPIASKETLTIQQSKRIFKLVKLHRTDYFRTLRTKLGWSGKLHPLHSAKNSP